METKIRGQLGQSLIETIIGIFVLTTGLISGLGLAIYAFGASANIVEQITATGLAREGIEAVRAMRDSNWLAGTLSDCENSQKCYADWLTRTYDMAGSTGGDSYLVSFFPTGSSPRWTISKAVGSAPNLYRLSIASSGDVYTHQTGSNLTQYFRKVTIIRSQESAPYTPTSPLLLVRSVVWWHGKNCPPIMNYNNPSDTNCKIVTEEYLTNWKNY